MFVTAADSAVEHVRGLVAHGVGLRAADGLLAVAEDLLAAEPASDAGEVRTDLLELRGIIARDNFETALAVGHFERARALALGREDFARAARLSLEKATVASLASDPAAAWRWWHEAVAELSRIPSGAPGDLVIEAYVRLARLVSFAGRLDLAEEVYRRRILPSTMRYEAPGLTSTRMVTLARMTLTTRRDAGTLSDAERALKAAERVLTADAGLLRQIQWHVGLAEWLAATGDPSGARREAVAIGRLLELGQFRHRGAEDLLDTFGLPVPRPPAKEISSPMPDTRPTQTFHTNVFGDRANVTVGAGVVFASQVAAEEDLFAVLRREGIGDDALEELRAALLADQAADPDADEPWPRVRAWMTKWLGRTGSVAGKIGIGASGGLVAHAIESYLQTL